MMRLALREAKRSECNNQHGCVLARKKTVLGRGYNSYKASPAWGSRKVHSSQGYVFFTLHAEASAIRQAVNRGIDVAGSTLYVARAGFKNSRPCDGCMELIRKYQIDRIFYTNSQGQIDEYEAT